MDSAGLHGAKGDVDADQRLAGQISMSEGEYPAPPLIHALPQVTDAFDSVDSLTMHDLQSKQAGMYSKRSLVTQILTEGETQWSIERPDDSK
jgi:hypothetical protein